MHKKFDSSEIEKKWQARWEEAGLYAVGERDHTREKEYVLVEWPYPSGNLHIGHWYAFAVPDIYVRTRRMQGKQVIYPMGFDAFGLPAENAALKRNINPREWTESNIAYMREQLASMGNAFSWDKTTSSTDQDYYRWTQWMFTQFYENGIAYRGEGVVNWCPGCHTVIANEQVQSDDTCERCGSAIEKKRMPQWMLRITDFADALTDDLDALDWPEHIKEAQRQWIGRSKGAEIDFTLSTGATVTVFTTRPDTLFGATYLVLAPEHPQVRDSIPYLGNVNEVSAYVEQAAKKAEQDRLDATKEKTGVQLEGITATNPASGEQIPVYIADYVLGGYGTGAIMAVPAHDERDYAFAHKFGLPIRQVVAEHFNLETKSGVETIDRGDVVDLIIEHPTDGTFLLQRETDTTGDHVHFAGGGTEGELHELAIARELLEETGFTDFEIVAGPVAIHTALAYRHTKDKNQKIKSHFYHLKLKSLTQVSSEIEEGKHTIEWTPRENVAAAITWTAYAAAWDTFNNNRVYTGPGTLVNADPYRLPTHTKFGTLETYDVTRVGAYALITDGKGKYLVQFFENSNYYWLPGGGVDDGETIEQALVREVYEETGYQDFTVTHLVDQVYFDFINGKGQPARNITNVFAVTLHSEQQDALNHTEDELADRMAARWVTKEELLAHTSVSEFERNRLIVHCIERFEASQSSTESFDGMDSEAAKEKIVATVGGRMTNTYRLRDWSIGRQRYWGVPIPIVYSPDGVAHVVPKEHLPWTLPEDVDFTPTGEPPLAKSAELKARTEAIFGPGWTPEVETMDTFVDSSWYFLRYLDNQNENELASLKTQKDWMPIDMYFGGAEHTTMHLLYSRFWQKALFKLGLVTENEPYRRRINRGLILGPDGNKMSKSKGNVIDPDEQVARVGADTVKMYLAFMGPYADGGTFPWDMGGIAGLRRFLERVNGLTEHIVPEEPEAVTRQLHKTIAKMTSDLSEFKFNTAISAMMVYVNAAEKLGLTAEAYTTLLKLLAPFAPHLTEELWAALGHTTSIHLETYPEADLALTIDSEITLGVQVNGKLRGTVAIAPDAAEATAIAAAKQEPSVAKWLDGEVKKVIYVPSKILNFITAK